LITFKDLNPAEPYQKLKHFYDLANESKQEIIEALCVSSFSLENNEVDSRFVNLKSVIDTNFIFFSNYRSPKSFQFKSHDQISAVIFWSKINVQIRMKANIKKTSKAFSDNYFVNRQKSKNALAISSDQSKLIESYELVEAKYKSTLENNSGSNLIRPSYWGGYVFTPNYFEFWEGQKNRVNKRQVFSLDDKGLWNKFFIQP
jgi:pyridoxamine 5'-phosphate oxidase